MGRWPRWKSFSSEAIVAERIPAPSRSSAAARADSAQPTTARPERSPRYAGDLRGALGDRLPLDAEAF